MNYRLQDTSYGTIALVFSNSKAIRIFLPDTKTSLRKAILSAFPDADEDPSGMNELTDLIVRYFEGKDVSIPIDHVDTSLVTPFQLRVLLTERTIPRGMTASYSWLARNAGTEAIRAAGSALARNPWPIVIPCHRAVRMDRTIGSYQGGAEMKQRLLMMEGVSFEDTGKVARDHFLK
ncbi:MAG: methylated-DNA--[protein]-cysteine S-methyltransferase [Candidatus Thorarchaeota archaeon]